MFAYRRKNGWEFVYEDHSNEKKVTRVSICRSTPSTIVGATVSNDPSHVADWISFTGDAEPFRIEFALLTPPGTPTKTADQPKTTAPPPGAQPRRKKAKYTEDMPLEPWLPINGWPIPGVQKMPLGLLKVRNLVSIHVLKNCVRLNQVDC
jgi:hypothetical protein